MKDDFILLTGNANRELADRISGHLGIPLTDMQVFKFSNDNTFVRIEENIRRREVFIIQPTCVPVNDNIMELLIIMDACRRASAQNVTAVVPYFAYARSDKKDQPRVPITAKLVADLIETAGADRILTMDLHSEQIQGFFSIPVDHLYAAPVIIEYLRSLDLDEYVVVAPDVGSAKRARGTAKRIGADLAIVDKRRVGNVDTTEVLTVIGEVSGKNCIILDDLIDTGGTLVKAAEMLVEQGARDIYAVATHPVLSGPAIDRIEKSVIRELVVTDTIPIPKERMIDKIRVLSVSGLLARAISRIFRGESVSSLFMKG
jgi:ribose-phosphate pyrophosphokinase